MTEDFKTGYAALPPSFLNNTAPYMSFLSRFGTHYLRGAHFGGKITHRTTYAKSIMNERSKNSVQNEQKGVFAANKDSKSGNIHNVKMSGKESVRMYGGNLTSAILPFTREQIASWESSIHDNVHIIHADLRPISELITDKDISGQVAQAIIYSVRSDAIHKFGDIMEIIKPEHLPNHDSAYTKQHSQFSKLFKETTESNEAILTKVTNGIQEEMNRLSLKFENLKGKLAKLFSNFTNFYILFSSISSAEKFARKI